LAEPEIYLLVALSGRALAVAARRAGRRTVVADLFGDTDTRASAEASLVVEGDFDDGFDAAALLAAAERLAPASPTARFGLVYGSGLESHTQHGLARAQMSGFTGMLSVELRGGYQAAESFISGLKLVTRAASLGGFESLAVHPAAMWGLQMTPEVRKATGISESLVRISAGLEDEKDLIQDFERALSRI
jgi:NAD(P)-dependent dehydrogenase (short-subunit alcohol dehydrogenase family)